MVKSEKAIGFRFLNYKISNFSFTETNNENDELDMSFKPKGVYNELNGEYLLQLDFTAKDAKTSESVIDLTCIANFQFDNTYKIEELPSHFYLSAIPIFFPYIRSFVSTLTLQANTGGIVVLGLINFTNMAEPLKENTSVNNVKIQSK